MFSTFSVSPLALIGFVFCCFGAGMSACAGNRAATWWAITAAIWALA